MVSKLIKYNLTRIFAGCFVLLQIRCRYPFNKLRLLILLSMNKIMFHSFALCIFYSCSSLGRMCYLFSSFPVVVSVIICIRSRLKDEIGFWSLMLIMKGTSFVKGALKVRYTVFLTFLCSNCFLDPTQRPWVSEDGTSLESALLQEILLSQILVIEGGTVFPCKWVSGSY